MRPLKIETNNFLPFPGVTSLDLSTVKAAIVSGPNGAGKSSFFIDSLLMALSGHARKTLDELICDTTDSMYVKLTFDHNGRTYRVERYIEKEKPQRLKIFDGDKNISERLLKATQAKLDDILKMSNGLLLSTAIAQQDEINQLSKMGPSDREKLLSEMTGIQTWEEKKKKVNDIINKNPDLNRSISDLEVEISLAQETIAARDLECKQWLAELYILTQSRDSMQADLDMMSEQLSQYEAYKEMESHLAVAQSEVKNLQELLANVPADDLAVIKLEIEQQRYQIKTNTALVEEIDSNLIVVRDLIHDITNGINNASVLKQLSEHTAILNKVPCVGMDIHNRCQLLSSAQSTQADIDDFLKDSSSKTLDAYLEENYKKLAEVTASKLYLEDSKGKLLQLNNDLKLVLMDHLKRQETIKKIKTLNTTYLEKIAQCEHLKLRLKQIPPFNLSEYNTTKSIIDEYNKGINRLQIDIGKLEREIAMLQEKVEENQKKLLPLHEAYDKLANYNILYKAYNEIPALLFEQAMPFIEQHANQILERISPGKSITLRAFRETKAGTQQKTVDVIGNTPTGTRDFYNLSGSEKFRQSLALRLALARYNSEQNNAQINFFIVDEGFGSLDDENLFQVKATLREIASEFDLFLVITHISELADTFDKKIIVQPQGKGERIRII
jgi:DNA repair exonuclease SbcCD ATPase subunit